MCGGCVAVWFVDGSGEARGTRRIRLGGLVVYIGRCVAVAGVAMAVIAWYRWIEEIEAVRMVVVSWCVDVRWLRGSVVCGGWSEQAGEGGWLCTPAGVCG
jgi:hypothetical protein